MENISFEIDNTILSFRIIALLCVSAILGIRDELLHIYYDFYIVRFISLLLVLGVSMYDIPTAILFGILISYIAFINTFMPSISEIKNVAPKVIKKTIYVKPEKEEKQGENQETSDENNNSLKEAKDNITNENSVYGYLEGDHSWVSNAKDLKLFEDTIGPQGYSSSHLANYRS